ncbi:Putative diheme cytochrome c-553 [Labilithrix luteola]|uniref:Putative diheme cytochrome c-553 n=1 Tax=Labilithrix luteola TaxID=1391654 RepID=A0A0K1PWM8_9BACT|nr:c-type cytochrome [Labilithrix luteola]AKU97935.1 Putative diheme cytochrome c-553 [Labilithrix luteola]
MKRLITFMFLVLVGCREEPRMLSQEDERRATKATEGWVELAPVAGDPRNGDYLTSIGACKECHTLRAADGEHLDRTKLFGGGIPFAGPWGRVSSANVSAVASAMPAGILEATIRGQMAFKFQMPTDLYAEMADDDMRDLLAYLKTLTPVERRNTENHYLATWRPPEPRAPRPRPMTAPRGRTVERGKYLTTVAICRDCHSPRLPDGSYDEAHLFAGGGFSLRTGNGEALIPPNLTPDRETGIGTWTDADIERAVRHGVAADGHRLNPAMPYEVGLEALTDEDMGALILYLRSLPPVRRRLPENPHWTPSDPPDDCCFPGPVGGYDGREAVTK